MIGWFIALTLEKLFVFIRNSKTVTIVSELVLPEYKNKIMEEKKHSEKVFLFIDFLVVKDI